MKNSSEALASQLQELRRGTIVLAILAKLQEPKYGYALTQALEEAGVAVETGTLYPLLRRLEAQNLLTSTWDTTEARPRKYYVISEEGRELYQELVLEWNRLSTNLALIINQES